jgi:hypothetical protein
MKARHVIASIDGMVAILVNLISKGYRYYFTGTIDDSAKRPLRDSRMQDYYEADVPKWTRERRRQRDEANFRYLRFDDWFIVLATEGAATRFWQEDRHRVRDIRNIPIRFKGYSISYRQGGYQSVPSDERSRRNAMWAEYRACREQEGKRAVKPPPLPRDMKWHARVQLDAETYAGVKAYFLNIATHRQADFIAREFLELQFQPYRPVREQLLTILRAVNRDRQIAGYQRVPYSVVRFKRRIAEAFAKNGDAEMNKSLQMLIE